MGDKKNCLENIEYNKRLGVHYCKGIITACEQFINGTEKENIFIQEEYIREKVIGIKQVNKRLRELYREKKTYL